MEVQQNILSKIRNETKQHLQSEIFPLISQLVENKMKEESSKFFEKTNILGDIFPKPIGSGIFKACGKCCRCLRENEELKLTDINSLNKCPGLGIQSKSNLRSDEYIFLCSGYGNLCECFPIDVIYQYTNAGCNNGIITKDNFRGVYITNYGTIIELHKNRHSDITITTYHTGQNMLTQEFITYYNNYIDYSASGLRTDNYGSKRLNHNDLKYIIDTYNEYNPKASEVYRIEKQKEEIEKMTLDLQQRETEIIQDEKILYEKQMEFIKEKEKYTEEKKIHKQKSKNLLRRENSVFLKESIKSVHQELKDISYSLSDTIDILDDIEPSIEQRLNQIIQKLNDMFTEELIVEAVEVQ